MAFGQQSGFPASAKQVQELLTLLRDAGHADFRDARGPMGFTQRQAAGRFTRDEASELIERLEAEEETRVPAPPLPSPRRSAGDEAMHGIPDERLAAELRRRGWTVTGPQP